MHLKISGYTLALNIENNLHKQTKITLSDHFPLILVTTQTSLPQMEGKMSHKPSPGTRGLVSNQGGISLPRRKIYSLKKKVIEISRLSTLHTFVKEQEMQKSLKW